MSKVGRKAKYEAPEDLELAIDAYFEEFGNGVTISGLAYYLGFESRQSMYDYKERPEFSYIIKRAALFIEQNYEGKLSNTSPTGAIFALKNMGWKDKHEQELTGANGGPVVITGMNIL
jgi:hypothetical protein